MPTDKDLDAAEARIGDIAPAKGAEARVNAISDKATAAYDQAQQGAALVDGLKRYKDSNPTLVAAAMDGLGRIGASDVVAKGKAIEHQLSKFAERSQIVLNGLDLIAGAHPFIGAAVSVLKAAIQLEITRRNNDKKVLALKDKMIDMMDVLRSLKDVKDPSRVAADGTTLQGRMQRTLDQAMKDIHECSATCEEYLHKKFIARLLDGSRWEGRLASYGDVFDNRRDEFVFALNIHTAHGVDNLQDSMGASQNQLSMLLLFVQLQSPEERDLIHLIEERGGPEACLSNEQVFAELQANMKVFNAERDSAAEVQIAMDQIRADMKEDIDVALAKERKAFDHKFRAIQETMEEMKNAVTRNSDHNAELILTTMKSGPHERILDKDLHDVWEFMSWRGSVKGRQFIVSIQDHFLQRYGGEGEAIPNREEDTTAPPDSALSAEDPAQDKWAIKYITLTRVRPILEAFDDDASGWISIKEANTFTSTRPVNYSVLKWLAFWAAGFRVVCKYYALKIDAMRVKMIRSAADALPCNRLLVDKYLSKRYMDIIDYLTRGVLTKDKYDGNEDDHDRDIGGHFYGFVKSEEARLQRNLDRFGVIDDSDTLSLILGPGRLERNIFPLLFLVLVRHYHLLRLAAQFRIDDQDFDEAEASLTTIRDALEDRVHTLISNYRNQNLDPKQQLGHAYNRMKYSVYYAWTLNENVHAHQYQDIARTDLRYHAPTAPILRYEYGPPSVPLHFYESFIAEDAGPSPSLGVNGLWVGRHYYGDISRGIHDGMLAIRVDVSDGKVTGEGKDCLGKFTVIGTSSLVDPSDDPTVRLHIEFDTTAVYLSQFSSLSPVFRYVGDVQTEEGLFTKICGKWFVKNGHSDTFVEKGEFILDRSIAIVARHRPAVMDAKTRWDMLAKVVLEQVRRRQGKWEYYRMRREDRIRLVEANQRCFVTQQPERYLRRYPPGDSTRWFTIRREIESRLVVEDIAFYRWLAQQRLRSETVHLGVICDACKGSPIGPRFICLDCKPDDPNRGIDLCSNCRDATLSFPAPRSLEHVPSHDMLKTLRVLRRREIVRTLNRGRWRLAIARQRLEQERTHSAESLSQDRPSCLVCKSNIAKPCWSCISCPARGDAFLCDSCEFRQLAKSLENPKRDWKEAPTMDRENGEAAQRDGGDGPRASNSSSSETNADARGEGDSSAHFWWHVLVRVEDSPSPVTPSKLELDARLSILEQKFTAAQSSLLLLEQKSIEAQSKLDDAQSKLDSLVDLVVALEDKVNTGLDGRFEKLENAARVQQGKFDAQIAGVEALLRQVLAKLG